MTRKTKPEAPDPQSMRDGVRRVIKSFDAATVRTLRRSAGFDRLREAAIRTEHAAAVANLGADVPVTLALRRRLEIAERRARAALSEMRVAEAGSQIQAGQATVLGQVTDAGERPLPDVSVTLTDERGGAKGHLIEGQTDAAGFYLLQAPATSFRSFFKRSKQLVLELEGGHLGVRHTSIEPIGDVDRLLRRIDVALPSESVHPPDPAEPTPEIGKPYLAKGAAGSLVERLQRRLVAIDIDPGGIDGRFGANTERAVIALQESRELTSSGEVDEATWRALFATDPPSVFERALGVTAAFEGHGFSHAAGNFDGAGLTWGIIGFTLRHGELAKIVRTIDQRHPGLVAEAFGPQRSKTLLATFRRPTLEQIAWADSISRKANRARLHKPWAEAFARFGELPEVQALQLELADIDYGQPARRTARKFGISSELGFALCFDIHVQNGGIKRAARRQIEDQRAGIDPNDELALRRILANAVADHARRKFREDVRARKLTLAEGEGDVHGKHYVLRNWGLDESPA